MASSKDGKLIFIALDDCVKVYKSAEFSSKTPPDPSSIFPFNPVKILRPTRQQSRRVLSRILNLDSRATIRFNHIRSGWISKCQESLVAVGEYGAIFVWDLGDLEADPILLDSLDSNSTWGIAMSANNFLLATSSNSHAVTIFHFPSRRVIFSEYVHDGDNGNDANDGKTVHSHNIPSLDFSPCGRWLASCSIDGSAALWSIKSESVVKMTPPPSLNEWGWLVRFVSPHQYDRYQNQGTNFDVVKSFYHSIVEEIPQVTMNDLDFDEELYRNSQAALDRMVYFMDGFEDEEYFGNDQLQQYNSDEIENENETEFSEEEGSLGIPHIRFDFPGTEFDVISGEGHLAEGVTGDTWPASEDYSADEGYTPYNSEDSINSSDYSYDFSSDYSNDHVCVSEDDEDPSTSYSDNTVADDTSTIEDICNEFSCTPPIDINFDFSSSTEGLFLAEDIITSPLTCPYDLVFCTDQSLFILNPNNGHVKLSIPRLAEHCFLSQNDQIESTINNGFPLQNRLGMGEWIPELSIFLVINCIGHFIIISPIDTVPLQVNSIILPDILEISNQIIGYTVVRRFDQEFGIKVHIYLLCEDGNFKLYEISKSQE